MQHKFPVSILVEKMLGRFLIFLWPSCCVTVPAPACHPFSRPEASYVFIGFPATRVSFHPTGREWEKIMLFSPKESSCTQNQNRGNSQLRRRAEQLNLAKADPFARAINFNIFAFHIRFPPHNNAAACCFACSFQCKYY